MEALYIVSYNLCLIRWLWVLLFLNIVALGLTCLIASFMPDSGWLYWTLIILIILGWLLYLVSCAILFAVYYLDSHEAQIKGFLSDTGSFIKDCIIKGINRCSEIFWSGKYL